MRQVKSINTNWYFSKTAQGVEKATLKEFREESIALLTYPGKLVFHGCSDWVEINVPHTWNGIDGQDGGNDYYRGTCYYLKNIPGEFLEKDQINYLEFDGVNSSASIYWNGKEMLVHHGGYSTFRVKIEEIQETNLLIVAADNSPNDFVYPQNADFTFYGGIYRDVKLVSVDKNHFAMDFWGAPGIKVTPVVNLDENKADITVESFVELEEKLYTDLKSGQTEMSPGRVSAGINTIKVKTAILDCEGNTVCKNTKVKRIGEIGTGTIEVDNEVKKGTPVAKAEFVLENPHLWNGLEDPYLYTLSKWYGFSVTDCEEVNPNGYKHDMLYTLPITVEKYCVPAGIGIYRIAKLLNTGMKAAVFETAALFMLGLYLKLTFHRTI